MDRWAGRVALVTGASSGIGRGIASRLVEHGLVVVACARRLERLEELKISHAGHKGRLIPIQCDLRKEEEILSMFKRIKEEEGGVDVCVNNAGVFKSAPLIDGSTELWREMLELNVLATCICTRETIKSMREREVDDGFIINIGSLYGHSSNWINGAAIYAMTKHALVAFSKGLDSELMAAKSRIRVVEISPGLVKTEVLLHSIGQALSDEFNNTFETLSVDDIADCVVFCLSVPTRAKVSTLIYDTTAFHFTETMNSFLASNQSQTE